MEQIEQVVALSRELNSEAITLWSDQRRNEFVSTFDSRVRVARWLLLDTANQVLRKAQDKHFISSKYSGRLPEELVSEQHTVLDGYTPGGYYSYASESDRLKVGDRTVGELRKISTERAESILNSLPQLSEAVRILSPQTAQMIEERDRLFQKGKRLLKESESVSGTLEMDEFPDNMTLSAFKAMVKEREKARQKLLLEMSEVGKEGQALDNRINKFLYSGLPGLSDAVMKVVTTYHDRSTAFSALNRRVAEQVQFGDSEAALTLLKTFEKDESSVSDEVRVEFERALEVLRAAGEKSKAKAKKGK